MSRKSQEWHFFVILYYQPLLLEFIRRLFAVSILDVAMEMDIDVIVMGSHSRKWLEHILLGSVTADVLKHTTIPMFIVPTKERNKN